MILLNISQIFNLAQETVVNQIISGWQSRRGGGKVMKLQGHIWNHEIQTEG